MGNCSVLRPQRHRKAQNLEMRADIFERIEHIAEHLEERKRTIDTA